MYILRADLQARSYTLLDTSSLLVQMLQHTLFCAHTVPEQPLHPDYVLHAPTSGIKGLFCWAKKTNSKSVGVEICVADSVS